MPLALSQISSDVFAGRSNEIGTGLKRLWIQTLSIIRF